MRLKTAGLVSLVSLVASPALLGQNCDRCPLTYEVHPYPKRTDPRVMIGWNGTDPYLENGLLGPMLVPVEIASRDEDTVLIKCNGSCTPYKICTDWTIDWEVAGFDPQHPTYKWRQGSFVSPHAERHDTLKDRWAVLYLPPEDLTVGETRSVSFTAKIIDLCEEGVDPVTEVVFTGYVKRTDHDWEVSLKHDDIVVEDIEPPECEPMDTECELVGLQRLPLNPPSQRFKDMPTRMFVNEVRAFTFAAKDIDRLIAECGIPVSTPPCSTFNHKDICDEISYSWSWIHANQGDEGEGIFEKFGTSDPNQNLGGSVPRAQTVMFSATKAGKLRLVIVALSKSGDSATFTHDLEIFERKTKYVDHRPADQLDIYYDGQKTITYKNYTGGGLPGIEWIDNSGDGDALDVGDHNFPMAYKMGASPQLEFFAQTALETLAMPGAVLFASDDTMGIQYLGRLNHAVHLVLPNAIFVDEIDSFGSLPMNANKHVHKVGFEVLYHFLRPAPHEPEHDYRVYTTLDTPNEVLGSITTPTPNKLLGAIYRYWESGYEVSCISANGATTEAQVRNRLAAHFGGLTVTRKPKDGFNQTDGAPMIYWGDVNTVAYGSTCSDLESMLNATGTGIGRCGSMAHLFRLCLGLHGVDSVISVFEASMPTRIDVPGFGPRQISPIPGHRVKVDFLVKNWGFNPPGGDSSELLAILPGGFGSLTPVVNSVNVDPDRPTAAGGNRTFHFFDRDRPHGAAWAHCIEQPGQGGVGAPNPRSWFNNHALVNSGGVYWDPSYGAPAGFANAAAYATASIVGVATIDLKPLGLPAIANAQCMFESWAGGFHAPLFTLTDTVQ